MKIVLIMLIFVIVLFLYLHIFFHIKTSNDLEVYECETPDKDKLEEICGLRQPFIFNYEDNIHELCNIDNLKEHYSSFDFKIRNTNNEVIDEEELYIPLQLSQLRDVVDKDKEGKYISERNGDFLEDTGIVKTLKYNDPLLRPYFTAKAEYDIMTGSVNSRTPFRYNLNYRNYYNIINGVVKIKLSPPRNSKFLYEVKDYDNYEFRSEVNPWNVSDIHKDNFEKIKCLELTLYKGQLIYIPPYWWYSIEYQKDAVVVSYKYHTYMSLLSISQHQIIALLQSQNIKRVPYLNIINDDNVNAKTYISHDTAPDCSEVSEKGDE